MSQVTPQKIQKFKLRDGTGETLRVGGPYLHGAAAERIERIERVNDTFHVYSDQGGERVVTPSHVDPKSIVLA